MRVYSLPRSQFFVDMDGLALDPRAAQMRKDPVTYIVQPDLPRGRPGRSLAVTLAAWSLWKAAQLEKKQAAEDRRCDKRSAEQAGLDGELA